MISAVTNYRHTTGSPTEDAATATTASSNSSGFGSELQSQLSLPDILKVFEGTATPSGSSSTPAAPATPAAQPASPSQVPTAQSVFGDQPWMEDPQGAGADGSKWSYNPIYFATQATAQQVASMVGGTVFTEDAITSAPGTTLHQTTPNEMVLLPGGAVLNPGLIADFYDHGYSQSMVNQMIQNEIQGVEK